MSQVNLARESNGHSEVMAALRRTVGPLAICKNSATYYTLLNIQSLYIFLAFLIDSWSPWVTEVYNIEPRKYLQNNINIYISHSSESS